jgi:hypothetical protein
MSLMFLKSLLLVIALPILGKPHKTELDQLVDQWHQSAATANFDAYFDFMDDAFVFIGTAPNERWTKSEFATFSKPYFDRGKAWDFKPNNRKWNFAMDGKTAWFDEELDTWMSGCRATGILVKRKNKWKIIHYDLHVLIENEKMTDFLELRKK